MDEKPAADGEKQLGIFAKGKFAFKRPLSEEEFSEFKKNTFRLTRFSAEQSLFIIVDLNHRDYFRARDSYRQGFITGEIHAQHHLQKAFVDLNRRIINFLSSVRMFLDHTESNLKSRGDSAKFDRFRKACESQYDNSFSYRFLYKLRNYAQHCGFPASSFETSKQLPHSNADKKDAIVKFALQLDRDALLKYDSWGKRLLGEIKAKPQKFAIDDLLIDVMRCINAVNNELVLVDLPELITSIRALDVLVDEVEPLLNTHTPSVPIVCEPRHMSSEPPRRLNLTIHWFPLEEMTIVSDAIEKNNKKRGGP